MLVRPETVVRWHARAWRLLRRWRSSSPLGRPRVSAEVRGLIGTMARDNPSWGAERIRGELLKLGIVVSRRSVQRYRQPSPVCPPTQRWRTFLANHRPQLWAADLLAVQTLTFRTLYVLVFVDHARRELVHLNVAASPTAAWIRRQLIAATPWGRTPRYLVRDRDAVYGREFVPRARGLGIETLLTPIRAPRANAVAERLIGSRVHLSGRGPVEDRDTLPQVDRVFSDPCIAVRGRIAPRYVLMALTGALPELTMRSHDATWNRSRWDALPADGNRYEVVDGVLYMSTAPSFFHQWVVRQTLLALHEQVDRPGLGTTIMAPIGVFMPGCDPVQPDLLVVSAAERGIIRGGRIEGVPALLVEVQSPSSIGYDDRVKRQAYARAGVPEYCILRPATRDVLVCTRPDATLGDFAQSQLVAPGEELISPTLPVRLRIDAIFADAPDATL